MRAALALSLALMGLVPSGVILTAPPALAVQPDEVLPDAFGPRTLEEFHA